MTNRLNEFIRFLVSSSTNASLYSSGHQQVERQVEHAFQLLTPLFVDKEQIELLLVEDQLVYDGKPLTGSLYLGRLAHLMSTRGIGHITFGKHTSKADLRSFSLWLSRKDAAWDEASVNASITTGIVDLRLTPGGTSEALNELRKLIPDITDIPTEEIARFLEIYEGVKKHKKLSVSGISEIVTGFISSFHDMSGSLLALAPLRALDEYTFTHSTTVCVLNLAQAMSLGIKGQLLHDIGVAGMLHDIGKLFVPEEVITKQGSLDPDEWEMIRQHPVKGASYLLATEGVPRLAVVTAFEHHIRYDNSGYPNVSKDWSQSICSQMTTISDVFDALRTKRAYRGSVEFNKIISIISEQSGKELHPRLTGNFITMLNQLHDHCEP